MLTVMRQNISTYKPENGEKTETVSMPRGKLGIHLRDVPSKESSTIVSSVTSGSPLAGKVFEGDYILSVNGIDVRNMNSTGK